MLYTPTDSYFTIDTGRNDVKFASAYCDPNAQACAVVGIQNRRYLRCYQPHSNYSKSLHRITYWY